MSKRIVPLLCLCFLAAPAWSQTEPVSAAVEQVEPAEPGQQDEKILVVGQRPGPGLWKVSKGDHVLWIFGSYSPLPKKMEWRSHEVEKIISESQEYLEPPSTTTKIGFFKKIGLIPLAIGFQKLPDGATLKDVLPADVYARWLPLKARYLAKDDDVERKRPLFVAGELFSAGLRHAGLGNDKEVRESIFQIIKKNKLKVTSSQIEVPLDDPARMLKDFKKSTLDDTACFAKTLERLETDLDAMRTRANAWAKGDLEAIQKLNYADREGACREAMTNSTVIKERAQFQSLEPRMIDVWLASVDKALETNKSTFAMLPLHRLLDPKGVVAALQERGYVVDRPE
jgi:hypothetical protein